MNKFCIRLVPIILTTCYLLTACNKTNQKIIEPGVSSALAELRTKQIKNIKYNLSFVVPDSINEQLKGKAIIEFDFDNSLKKPLIIDFRNPASYLLSVKLGNKEIKYTFENEHIIIPYKRLNDGKNQISIEFLSGNRALNRNKEYLYTLFVPDRACTAFPCFDQPSLKANFQTTIDVPKNWLSVANSPLIKKTNGKDGRTSYYFEETELLPTYVYSFVAGKFKLVSAIYDDFEMVLYHREDDSLKIKRNIDEIFRLHYSSIKWLENYTQIDYPFSKFDFVIIPSFQYSGMEHPGAILYRDSRVFLEKTATIRDELNRANLIAHETAHMWFGDLVTMEWFSEVWLKEVFANFIAGKMVNPQFPDVNHELNFIINHYPPSMAIDRTIGANPIGQELGNMKNAGTLYGSIIYHKAPIVMNHLEKIISKKNLKIGIQEYLQQYQFGNATWENLIQILDKKSDVNLQAWSQTWVNEPGMPNYKVQRAINTKDNLESIIIEQTNQTDNGNQWVQNIEVRAGNATKSITLADTFNVVSFFDEALSPNYIFPNSNGLGYGYFEIDSLSIEPILNELANIKGPVLRCAMYISLWENMLNQNLLPYKLIDTFIFALRTETNPQNINLLLKYIETAFWKFTKEKDRLEYASRIEQILWNKMLITKSDNLKSSYFKAYKSIALTKGGVNRLYNLWNKEIEISGLSLSEQDFTDISFELAIRNVTNTEEILTKQLERISNIEKKERFIFLMPFVSNKIEIRDSFFESLKDEKNREKEPWVIDALVYLHHPLRSKESVHYIKPSLGILEELQITGDIFFPKRWLDATFYGHNSIDAVLAVNLFLNENPEFPENLKLKILQSTDLTFRASILNDE